MFRVVVDVERHGRGMAVILTNIVGNKESRRFESNHATNESQLFLLYLRLRK